MEVFETVVALLVGGAALAAVARRVGAPYPALVALAGAALALVPGMPAVVLDPELALALFVAPVLVDAAFDASPRDLRADWRAVTSLALGAVALTVVAVAVVARLLVPEMPWAVAVALGAVVAPPDAAAATAVLKALRPPHRLLTILEGESLFNDASALLVYRLAVGAAVAGAFSVGSVAPTLLVVTVGSVALALVLARVVPAVIARVDDMATSVVFQFCGAFAVWLLAERLHLSGIIVAVVFAMAVSRRSGTAMPARVRVASWAVWEVAVFVLNVLAFVLVGLQLRLVAERASGAEGAQYALVAVAVTATVVLARLAWVTGTAAVSRWWCRPRADGTPGPRDAVGLGGREAAVVGWCGMRGIVTLATALALPTGFPFRDLVLATAFGVTLATLVLQGLTLRPLMLRLRLEDDGQVEREVRLARVETLRAALAAAEASPDGGTAALVRHSYALQLRQAEDARDGGAPDAPPGGVGAGAAVLRAASEAQRRRLLALRADGTIGDAAFQRVEEEQDRAELGWSTLAGDGEVAEPAP